MVPFGLGTFVVALLVGFTAGCGNVKTTPHSAATDRALSPTQEDADAGLVGVEPGFDIKRYRAVVVERFTVTDPGIADAEDKRIADLAPGYLQEQLMRRLRESGLFDRVIEGGTVGAAAGAPALRLTGEIAQVQGGSRHLRFWVGFGAGRSKVELHTRFVDASTNEPVLVTATRRVAAISEALSLDYGGSNEDLIKEALRDSARDLALFLVRLARGEAPKTR